MHDAVSLTKSKAKEDGYAQINEPRQKGFVLWLPMHDST